MVCAAVWGGDEMKCRIHPLAEEKQNPETSPNQLDRVFDVAGHLYAFDDSHIRAIYPMAEPMIIMVEEDFEIEGCLDRGCKDLVARRNQKNEHFELESSQGAKDASL